MAIIRWEPYREMARLRNAMDRVFDDSLFGPARAWREDGTLNLPIDMYQTDDDVVVKATMPGVNPDEVDISIQGDTLNISGEHKEEQETKEENYLYRERRYGSFSRSVMIPTVVEADKAEATFENGVLTLTLPKAEPAKAKQIKIKPKKMIEDTGKK